MRFQILATVTDPTGTTTERVRDFDTEAEAATLRDRMVKAFAPDGRYTTNGPTTRYARTDGPIVALTVTADPATAARQIARRSRVGFRLHIADDGTIVQRAPGTATDPAVYAFALCDKFDQYHARTCLDAWAALRAHGADLDTARDVHDELVNAWVSDDSHDIDRRPVTQLFTELLFAELANYAAN